MSGSSGDSSFSHLKRAVFVEFVAHLFSLHCPRAQIAEAECVLIARRLKKISSTSEKGLMVTIRSAF